MTSQENLDQELPFHPDFAARVLDAADGIAERHRRVRLVVTSISTAVVTGVVTLGAWQTWRSPAPGAQRIPREIASIGGEDISFTQGKPMSPLDFMFPDAAPLAKFSEQYSDGDDGDTLEDDAVFFPDAPADVEVDGS